MGFLLFYVWISRFSHISVTYSCFAYINYSSSVIEFIAFHFNLILIDTFLHLSPFIFNTIIMFLFVLISRFFVYPFRVFPPLRLPSLPLLFHTPIAQTISRIVVQVIWHSAVSVKSPRPTIIWYRFANRIRLNTIDDSHGRHWNYIKILSGNEFTKSIIHFRQNLIPFGNSQKIFQKGNKRVERWKPVHVSFKCGNLVTRVRRNACFHPNQRKFRRCH